MASASYQSARFRLRPTPRRRAAALLGAVGLVALLLLLLLRLGVLPAQPPSTIRPNTFQLSPEGEQAAVRPRATAARKAAARARPAKAPRVTPPAPVPPVPTPFPALRLDHDTLAATDIGAMAKAPGAADGAGDDDSGTDSAAVYGPGEGPGGARLYYAQWYREPPAGALALYLPGGPRPGWAMIACRTIADYHVDNCRELGESPRGAGTARALRQAAWQFLVRPPRLGGKPLIGAWVRIRFDFSERGAELSR